MPQFRRDLDTSRFHLTRVILCLFALLVVWMIVPRTSAEESPLRVVFINPGVSNTTGDTGAFWTMVTSFMQACAKDLHVHLEVHYAEREYVRMVALTNEAIARKPKPHYLVVVNEKLIAEKLLQIASRSDVRVILLLNDLTQRQKEAAGNPGKKYKNWVGSVIPNNRYAGYLLAERLILEAKQRGLDPAEMIAINGNRATPASVEREIGLREALAHYGHSAILRQVVYGEWSEEQGYLKAEVLLKRYPQVSLIWIANDPMGFGAISAAKALGRIPGKDIFAVGLNWSRRGIEAVKDGDFVADAGGHFMLGAWALVMLYDFHHGIDFASTTESRRTVKVFHVLDADSAASYTDCFAGEDWDKIDFTKFSLVLNPSLSEYDFSLRRVMAQCSTSIDGPIAPSSETR